MDRRNGGDIFAPPRPPKHLPRIHRPRAPEPESLLSIAQMQQQNKQQPNKQQQMTATTTALAAAIVTEIVTQAAAGPATFTTPVIGTSRRSIETPQCTNSSNFPSQYSITSGVGREDAVVGDAASTCQNDNETLTTIVNALIQPEYDDYEIHHLTILPQRPTTLNLSRNNSHMSTTSSSASSSSITAANTFTRRRQSPPTSGVAARLLINNNNMSSSESSSNNNNIRNQTHISNISNSNNSGAITSSLTGLLSHFHSNESVADAQSVTLAQPRPESQRLTNDYVDTPFRNQTTPIITTGNAIIANQLQLQHTSRAQHPAGQHDGSQTTTHHLLLLPQRDFRQQQHQQVQLHSNRYSPPAATMAAGMGATMAATLDTVSSASVITTTTSGIDNTDGYLRSHKTPKQATTICPYTEKIIPIAPQNGYNSNSLGSFHSPTQEPFAPTITKQPASTTSKVQSTHLMDGNNCKFAKNLPAFDELLTMHNISTGISTPQGMISAVHGASPLGTPIIIGSGDTASLNQITCPRCGHCRCEQCQSPPHLPQTWLCNKTCLCSAESVIDYVSCLCCAKALFYHCARDNDMDCDDESGTPCVDNPCSCGPYKRTQRWGWLGALSLVLPCLWLYWPMRGCVSFCEKCYVRFVGRGCRCQQTDSPTNIISISQLGSLGGNGTSGTASILNSTNGGMDALKSVEAHHHHHYHHNYHHNHHHNMQKGDVTPKKRLLDSNGE